MKKFRNSMIFLLVCLFYAPVASTQNGAVIVRGADDNGFVEWNGESVVAVLSSDSLWYCEWWERYIVPYDIMAVIRPDGSIKTQEKGSIFARVYYPATAEDFWADPCDFIANGPMVADGIAHFTGNNNDANGSHPKRQNTYGYTLNGTLYDLAGFCADGMVHLNIVRKYKIAKNCESDCFFVQVEKGPRLSCQD